MDKESTESLNRKFIEIWEKGEMGYIEEILSPTFEHHCNGVTIRGREAYKDYHASYVKNLKNLKFTIDEWICKEEAMISYRWTCRCLFEGKYEERTFAPQKIEFSGITLLHVKEGQFTSGWFYNSIPEALSKFVKK